MILKEYALVNKKYRRLPDSKKTKAIVVYGYKQGENIVLTETVSYYANATLMPIVPPSKLKNVTKKDHVDLKISSPYKIEWPAPVPEGQVAV